MNLPSQADIHADMHMNRCTCLLIYAVFTAWYRHMYVSIYIYVCVYIYIHIYICIHKYIYICIHILEIPSNTHQVQAKRGCSHGHPSEPSLRRGTLLRRRWLKCGNRHKARGGSKCGFGIQGLRASSFQFQCRSSRIRDPMSCNTMGSEMLRFFRCWGWPRQIGPQKLQERCHVMTRRTSTTLSVDMNPAMSRDTENLGHQELGDCRN